MNIKEKTIEQTITVIEMTEAELSNIKQEERKNGQRDVFEYLKFVIKNYKYDFTISSVFKFFVNLIKFANGETDIIENSYNYSFQDFLNNTIHT